MNERRVTESLSAQAESLRGQHRALWSADAGERKQSQPVPLVSFANRLSDALQPVRPSADFVRSLGRELVQDAASRIEAWKKRRRSVTMIAAAVGTLLSLASLIGAAVYLAQRSRARAESGAIQQQS